MLTASILVVYRYYEMTMSGQSQTNRRVAVLIEAQTMRKHNRSQGFSLLGKLWAKVRVDVGRKLNISEDATEKFRGAKTTLETPNRTIRVRKPLCCEGLSSNSLFLDRIVDCSLKFFVS